MAEWLTILSQVNPGFAIPVFILLRFLSIVIPPIPGYAVDLLGLGYFHWLEGFLYAQVAVMAGAMAAFWIARTLREEIFDYFPRLRSFGEMRWKDEFSERQKFWALVFIRLPTAPVFDYVSYILGLTRATWKKFFFSTLIGNAIPLFLVYYVGGISYRRGAYFVILFLALLLVIDMLFSKQKLLDIVSKKFLRRQA